MPVPSYMEHAPNQSPAVSKCHQKFLEEVSSKNLASQPKFILSVIRQVRFWSTKNTYVDW